MHRWGAHKVSAVVMLLTQQWVALLPSPKKQSVLLQIKHRQGCFTINASANLRSTPQKDLKIFPKKTRTPSPPWRVRCGSPDCPRGPGSDSGEGRCPASACARHNRLPANGKTTRWGRESAHGGDRVVAEAPDPRRATVIANPASLRRFSANASKD